MNVDVVTENLDVQIAQHENSVRTYRVIEALKQIGIEARDIKTSSYSVQPKYEYVDSKNMFKGYEVEHSLQITVKDLSKAGMVYDVAIKNGANRASNLQFLVSNANLYYLTALTNAINYTKEKAEEIAQTIHVTVNPIPIKIIEENYQPIQPRMAGAFHLAEPMTAPPIQPGEFTLQANVKVVYEYSNCNVQS